MAMPRRLAAALLRAVLRLAPERSHDWARAMLHEIDHLNGVLFIDRISRLKRELVLRKIRKLQKAGEW